MQSVIFRDDPEDRSNVRRILRSGLITSASAFALLASHAASAQDNGQVVETVTVTAERHAEDIQKVPLAVTAITGEQLAARGITNSLDIATAVPNLYGSPTPGQRVGTFLYIRGLGTGNPTTFLDVAVSTYVDDVVRPFNVVSTQTLYDVNRVEVLRGPQGTTFGRNSTGGAIDIITQKPGDTFGGHVDLSYGERNDIGARGAVDIPLSDSVSAKVSGFFDQTDGWLRNLTTGQMLNGKKLDSGRFALTAKIDNDLSWDFSAEHNDIDGVLTRSFTGKQRLTRAVGTVDDPTLGNVVSDALANHLRDVAESNDMVSNFTWTPGDIAINVITGFNAYGLNQVYDTSGLSLTTTTTTPAPAYNANAAHGYDISQEIKASGSLFTDRLTYVAGVFYLSLHDRKIISSPSATSVAGPVTVSCAAGATPTDGEIVCPSGKLGYLSTREGVESTTSLAAYAQFDYAILDDLTATGGLRWTTEQKQLQAVPVALGGYSAGGLLTADLVKAGVPTHLSKSMATPRLALKWTPDANQMYYVSYSQGFKSGGWQLGQTPFLTQAVQPEETASYEAGTKLTLFEGKLVLDGDAFYERTKNLQLTYTRDNFIVPGGSPLQTLSNAGNSATDGVEMEFDSIPLDNLDVYGSLALQQGHYTYVNPAAGSFTTPTGTFVKGIDPGARLVYFPGYSGTFGVGYTWPLQSIAGTLAFNGDVNFQSGTWRIATNPTTPIKAYSHAFQLVNFSVGYAPDGSSWHAKIECDNCTNIQREIGTTSSSWFYDDPRTIKATIGYQW